MARDPLAVLEVELAEDVAAVEEAMDDFADRPALQAIGLVPVETLSVASSWRSMIAAAIGSASSKPEASAAARRSLTPELSARRCLGAAGGRVAAACITRSMPQRG